MKIAILGAGLSGLSLADLLQANQSVDAIDILEKESTPGGLCRSFPFGNVQYDIGPHIMFSRNPKILELMLDLLGNNEHKLRRSNRIWHDGRFVKYPFENELSALSESDCDYCLNTFLNNPYADYPPQNMLQFFLVTFGEGITNLFLRPYNEKIWKFDPAMMDTQMVERIPKPPVEDIIRSARGEATEGYLHQLYFHYPKSGGIETIIRGYLKRMGPKVTVRTSAEVSAMQKSGDGWTVSTADNKTGRYDRVVSTIPVPKLFDAMDKGAVAVPEDAAEAARRLKFNSIIICVLRVKRERLGDNFAITVADRSILFHRLSKVNFLFPSEAADGTTTIMAEVTFRKGDRVDLMADGRVAERVVEDLCRLGFLAGPADVLAHEISRHEFAYVIHDLDHRRNMAAVRDHCEKNLGLVLHGRFGEFEYLNMDQIVARSAECYKRMLAMDYKSVGCVLART